MERTTGTLARLEAALNRLRTEADAEAWQAFVEAIAGRVRGHLFMLGERNRGELDDRTQEVMLRFVQYAPWRHDWSTLPTAAEVAAYVRKTVVSVAIDASKTRPAHFELTRLDASQLDTVAGEMGPDVARVLGQLVPSLNREELILLRLVIEGRSLPDIAQLLDIKYHTAGARVSRLKDRLKNLMNSRG